MRLTQQFRLKTPLFCIAVYVMLREMLTRGLQGFLALKDVISEIPDLLQWEIQDAEMPFTNILPAGII